MSRQDFFHWRPHPWHGLEAGRNPPELVDAYIEITPADPVKYEIDKRTGYLRVDRPQPTSSLPPALYGFIPQTFCAERVAALSPGAGLGDGDPLDICVVSERPITRSEVIVPARVVGGMLMIDEGKADHKIIGVLENDRFWGAATDLADLPKILVERLQHYFQTYKSTDAGRTRSSVESAYGREHALEVVQAALLDYQSEFENSRPERKEAHEEK